MQKYIEVTGKTEDAAISAGLAQLGEPLAEMGGVPGEHRAAGPGGDGHNL